MARSQAGASGKSSGGQKSERRLALVTRGRDFLPGPGGEASRPSERLPGLGSGLPPGSLFSLSRQDSLPPPFPSRKPLAFPPPPPHPPVPRSPRGPPHPPPPSHPRTQTNDRITNPRSTDMFTRMTYALAKSKWERDQGRAAKDPGGFRAAQRWQTLDPQQLISRPARSPPSSALDCGGPVHPVWRESTQWAREQSSSHQPPGPTPRRSGLSVSEDRSGLHSFAQSLSPSTPTHSPAGKELFGR